MRTLVDILEEMLDKEEKLEYQNALMACICWAKREEKK